MTVDLGVPDQDRELVAAAFDAFLEDIFQGRASDPGGPLRECRRGREQGWLRRHRCRSVGQGGFCPCPVLQRAGPDHRHPRLLPRQGQRADPQPGRGNSPQGTPLLGLRLADRHLARGHPGIRHRPGHDPLEPDPWTDITIGLANSPLLVKTNGTLDQNGQAMAQIKGGPVNSPGSIGLVFYHAFLVYDASNNFYLASNPVTLLLEK